MASAPCLIHIISSNKWSGVERYALDICRHFSAEGWEVTALTRDARGVDALFRKEGIMLCHAPLHGISDLSSAWTLSKMLRERKGQTIIIHVHNYRDAFIALLARKIAGMKEVRVVSTYHRVKKGRDSRMMRRTYRNLDTQIFLSRYSYTRFCDTWRDKQLPFPEQRVEILSNSLLVEKAQPAAEPAKGPITGMFHGTITEGKGLEYLIDALALLRKEKIRIRIVGSGEPDYIDTLRQRASARGVMGAIDWYRHTDTPFELISTCHFGVLPAMREEAFGLANIEYMACGRPIVTTSSGAQGEYLTDGREALIVPPGNSTALADAMRHLAQDADLRRRMGEAAAQTFNATLSWPRFIARLRKIYLGGL